MSQLAAQVLQLGEDFLGLDGILLMQVLILRMNPSLN